MMHDSDMSGVLYCDAWWVVCAYGSDPFYGMGLCLN